MKRALAGGLLAAVVLGAAGCGGSRASQPDVRAVRDALAARLHAKQLRFSWVACVRNGRNRAAIPSGDSMVPPPASAEISPVAPGAEAGVCTFVTRERRLCQT